MKAMPICARRLALVLAACLCLGGCRVALIYSHTIEPFDLNQNETPIVLQGEEGDVKELKYSLLDVRWSSNAVGDIARANGIETVYFADMETLEVLFGIWTQRTLHIYGR